MSIEADLRALHVNVEDLVPQRTAHRGYVYYDVPLTQDQYSLAHSIQILEGRGEVHIDFAPGTIRETPVASETDLDTVLIPVEVFVERAKKLTVHLQDGYRGSRGILTFSAWADVTVDIHGFITPRAYAMDLRDAAYYRIPTNPGHRDVHMRGKGARSAVARTSALAILHGLTRPLDEMDTQDPDAVPWEDIDTPAKADFAALREEDRLNMEADEAEQWKELE